MKTNLDIKKIELSHGSGGTQQNQLIKLITASLKSKKIGEGVGIEAMDDGGTIPHAFLSSDLIVTADGHTISPLWFPGGDLGKLSVCGTVNDLLMMGAEPLALTSVVLVEEGFSIDSLNKIMDSFNSWANQAKVSVIAGDTKVMPKGTLNELIITTTGIGIQKANCPWRDNHVGLGQKILVSGPIADHGAALMANREGMELETELISDVGLLSEITTIAADYGVTAMKDVTRGGLAAMLNEWASKSEIGLQLDEEVIPIRTSTQTVCEILGLDPLELACEGTCIIAVREDHADSLVAALRKTEMGKMATIIGETQDARKGQVVLKTAIGGTRILPPPMGEAIPRIC